MKNISSNTLAVRRFSQSALAFAALLVPSLPTAWADTHVWTGDSGNMATAANWDIGTPESGDVLQFIQTGNDTVTLVNDLGDPFQVAQFLFNSTRSYTFTGGAFTLTSSITLAANPSTVNFLATEFQFSGSRSFNIGEGATLATGTIQGGTSSISKVGTGTWELYGATTIGTLSISGGTVRMYDGASLGSGNISLSSGSASLAFNRTTELTLSNTINGSGSLVKEGAGTVTLNGTLTNHTGAIVINAGRLEIGNSGSKDNGNISIASGATLAFTTTSAFSTAGAISGEGGIVKDGSGNVTLRGNNTYSGTTVVNAGNLSIGGNTAGGSIGTSNAVIAEGANLSFYRTDAYTVNNTLSGAGKVTKTGSGTMTYIGDASGLSGSIDVSTGTLQVDDGANLGTAAMNLSLNTNLIFNRSDTLVIANAISGGGVITKSGAGTVVFTKDNPHTGAINVNVGTLQIGNGGNAGNLGPNFSTSTVTIASDATLVFNRSDTVEAGRTFAGAGSIVQAGEGVVILSKNSTSFSGAITVNEGTLQVGNAGSTGDLGTASVVNNATLAFNRSNAYTVNNVISGTGSVVKMGSNTVTLTRDNTYTGGTTINAGSLQVGSGTVGGIVGDVAIAAGATLIINRTNEFTLSGVISGEGGLTKQGNGGTTILTNDSTYTGVTTVSAGILQVGTGGTVGSIGTGAISIASNSSFVLNRSDDLTFVNVLGGTGTFVKQGTNTLTLTGTNTHSHTTISGGVLRVGDGGTSGSLGTGNTSVAADATLIFNRSDDYTQTSSISGAGTVIKQGTGTLTYTGSGAFTGTVQINAGTVQVGTGSTGNVFNHREITVAAGATLAVNLANNAISNTITGGGAFVKNGTSVVAITGNLEHTGGTSVDSGTLRIGNNSTNGNVTGDITVAAGATLSFNRNDEYVFSGVVSGGGVLDKANTTGTTILTGSNTNTGGTIVNGGVLQVGNGGTSGSLGSGSITISGGSLAFNRSDTVTLDKVISGNGSLAQRGSGTLLILSDNTTRFGQNLVNAGTLQIGNGGTSGSLGTGSSTIAGDATLIYNRSDDLTIGGFSGAGTVIHQGTGTVTISGGSSSFSGILQIENGSFQVGNNGTSGDLGTASIVNNTTLVFNRSNAYTAANAISGTGNVIKEGTNTVTLTGASTYTGTTTINAGTLQVGSSTAGSLTSDATVAAGATLIFGRTDDSTYSGNLSGAGAVTKTGNGTLIFTGSAATFTGALSVSSGTLQVGDADNGGSLGTANVALGGSFSTGTLAFGGSGETLVSGAITGSGYLIQRGSGTTILTGANTYNNSTTVSSGTLQIGNGGTTGSLTSLTTTIAGGASVILNRSDDFTITGAFYGAGTLEKQGNGTAILAGFNNLTGTVLIKTGTLQVGTGSSSSALNTLISVEEGATLALNTNIGFSQVISGAGSVAKVGTGISGLFADNTYTGGTFLNGGILQIGNNGTIGSIVGDVVTASGTTLDIRRGNDYTFAGVISGAGVVTKQGAGALIFTGNNTYTGTTTISAGILQVGDGGTTGALGTGAVSIATSLVFNRSNDYTATSNISGAGSLVQRGTGVTTLTGVNTYTGATTIEAGTLWVEGELNNTSGVTVEATGRLGGTGSISGDVAVEGALALGGAVDPLTVNGNVTLHASAVLEVVIKSATEYGQLYLGGAEDVLIIEEGAQLFLALDYTPEVGASFDLLGGAGSLNNSSTQFANGTTLTLGSVEFLVQQNANNLQLVVTAVPEPSTYALLGGGILAGLALARRRRAK